MGGAGRVSKLLKINITKVNNLRKRSLVEQIFGQACGFSRFLPSQQAQLRGRGKSLSHEYVMSFQHSTKRL